MRAALLPVFVAVVFLVGCSGAPRPCAEDPDCVAGQPDGGGRDAGQVDAGQLDAGQVDAGQVDAGQFDAGQFDAGQVDAGQLDAGQLDAGQLDAGQLDAGQLDAGQLDAGQADAGNGSGTDGGASVALLLSEAELARRASVLAADSMAGRNEGTPGSAAARAFLIAELTACGVLPAASATSFEQPITSGVGTNILGRIPGTDPGRAARTVLLSAHYDHLGQSGGTIFNGAQDNAAGVAAVVGVACAIARDPLPRTVLIALWDAEEPPTFLQAAMGSLFFAQNPVVPLADLDAALVLDLVGGNLYGVEQGHNVLGAETSPQVRAALDAVPAPPGLLVHRGGLHLVEQTSSGTQPWSDYDAFRNRNVPVLFFSDGQNLRYHSATDDFAQLDLPKLARETIHLHAVVRALGSATSTPVFAPAGADYERDADTVVMVLTEALAPQGLVDARNLSSGSRAKLQADLVAAQAVKNDLAGGGTASTADVRVLRRGIQRVMCHASGTYSSFTCDYLL